jgi:antitoxin ParD1/3/4
MDDIRISLSDSTKSFVDAGVADGSYASVSECIDALVQAGAKAKAQEKLEALLLEGLESGDAEPWTEADSARLMRLAKTGR